MTQGCGVGTRLGYNFNTIENFFFFFLMLNFLIYVTIIRPEKLKDVYKHPKAGYFQACSKREP